LLRTVPQIGNGAGIEVFTYPATPAPPMPSWEIWGGTGMGANGNADLAASASPSTTPGAEKSRQAAEERLAEEARRSFEAGRECGIHEGRAAEREALAVEKSAVDNLCAEQASRLADGFHAERSRYFEVVESEVVKLALAVAARILRREAQMDPLLLTGAVRVALGQLSATTQVRLRVPPADLDLWTDTVAHLPSRSQKPVVIPGEGMRLGDCVMETELGSVDLGVRAQLGEIERGFFDRTCGNAAPIVEKATTIAEDMSE